MTLPTSYSWSPVGQPLKVDYEAPQGRRVNVLGAYCSQGVEAGRFVYRTLAKIPAKRRPESYDLRSAQVGTLNSEVLLDFLWREVAGKPQEAGADWQRCRPVVVVLDNYSVHNSAEVKAARPALAAAGLHLFYLPAYSPELSEIEPIWKALKYQEMTQRSFEDLVSLLRAVEQALDAKAEVLLLQVAETDTLLQRAA